jgi:single-stranded DNA-binding protein
MPKNNSIEYVEVSMCGRLGADPVIKEVTVQREGKPTLSKVANFSVAVNNRRADASAPGGYTVASTTWVNVSAWGILADLVSSLKKGQTVEVVGDVTLVSTYMTQGPAPEARASVSMQASRVSSSASRRAR